MERPSAASAAVATIRNLGAIRSRACRSGMAGRDVAHGLKCQIRYGAVPPSPFGNPDLLSHGVPRVLGLVREGRMWACECR